MTMNEWIVAKDVTTLFIGAMVASFGLRTYAKNAATRRAEFIVDLHKQFFVEKEYRDIRKLLDSEEESARAQCDLLVTEQSESLIEYLNFFELVAYLTHTGNLRFKDTDALLGYYLRCINDHSKLRDYIADTPRNGFEHLDKVLGRIAAER